MNKVENFIFDNGHKVVTVVVVVVVALCGWFLWESHKAEQVAIAQCEARGGAWVVTGTETGWRTQMVGKSAVQIPYTYNVYGCTR
jgi:hypothetical protein